MEYLLAPAIAWLAAQGLKHIFRLMGRNRRVFGGQPVSKLLLSGGMPSAHSAFVISFSLYLALTQGVNSPLFALSAVLAAIVIYDSVMVRYSSGRQGDALNSLLQATKNELWPLKIAHGHTMIEVVAGSILGAVVTIVVFLAIS